MPPSALALMAPPLVRPEALLTLVLVSVICPPALNRMLPPLPDRPRALTESASDSEPCVVALMLPP